jgi:hypothetical protein
MYRSFRGTYFHHDQSKWHKPLLRNKPSRISIIPRNLMKPMLHYRARKRLKLAPILSQINPFHTLPSDFITTHFNVLPPARRFSQRSRPFRFPHQNFVIHLISIVWRTSRLSHTFWINCPYWGKCFLIISLEPCDCDCLLKVDVFGTPDITTHLLFVAE